MGSFQDTVLEWLSKTLEKQQQSFLVRSFLLMIDNDVDIRVKTFLACLVIDVQFDLYFS